MTHKVTSQIIELPGWYLAAGSVGALGLALLLWLTHRLLAERKAGRRPADREPDWSIPSVDEAAEGNTIFHRWDARFKLAALFGYAFLVVSIHSPEIALLALLVSILAVVAARIPALRVVRRITAMAGFVGMFVLIMPITVPIHPGDTVIIFGGLPWPVVNLRGAERALAITAKAMAVALLMEPMLATVPFAKTLEALTRLGVPRKITQMVMLTTRYIYVFGDEARRMNTAMKMRGFETTTRLETLKTVAHFVGMLFVRSFDRTYRVNDAMLARGFKGEFPMYRDFRATSLDWILAGSWILLGICLLFVDRMGVGPWG